MKLVIVSDIHGNYDAWRALPEDYDELWVLGDLINYGPQPGKVVDVVMEKASLVVRGNHDDAVARDDDSRWSARYRAMTQTTRQFTSSVLSDSKRNGGPTIRPFKSPSGRSQPVDLRRGLVQ